MTTSVTEGETRAKRKPYDAWGLLRLYLARNFRVWTYFRVSFVTGLLSVACSALIFLFIGELVGPAATGSVGVSYASFVTVGMIFNQFYGATLRSPYDAIHRAYWSAQLESIILSPAPVRLLISGEVMWSHFNSLIRVGLYLLLGLAFGMQLHLAPAGLIPLLLAFLLGLTGVLGLGLMSAATFTLLNAKGNSDPVQWGVSTIQSLVTGIYFPVSSLPRWMQCVASAFPHTYALDAARRLLLPDYAGGLLPLHAAWPGHPVGLDLAALAVLAPLLYWAGGWMFARGVKQARRDGSLSRWT